MPAVDDRTKTGFGSSREALPNQAPTMRERTCDVSPWRSSRPDCPADARQVMVVMLRYEHPVKPLHAITHNWASVPF